MMSLERSGNHASKIRAVRSRHPMNEIKSQLSISASVSLSSAHWGYRAVRCREFVGTVSLSSGRHSSFASKGRSNERRYED